MRGRVTTQHLYIAAKIKHYYEAFGKMFQPIVDRSGKLSLLIYFRINETKNVATNKHQRTVTDGSKDI